MAGRRDGGLSSPRRRAVTRVVESEIVVDPPVDPADLRWFPTKDHAEAAVLAGEIDAEGEGTAWAVGEPPEPESGDGGSPDSDPDGDEGLDYDEALAGMTVDEITAAVEAGELDRAAVLAAERRGKNRKGVLALDPNA